MTTPEIIETLFPEETIPNEVDVTRILECLDKYRLQTLAYDGNMGCNPGYIFRGEIDYPIPLQSSLERKIRKKDGSPTKELLQECERELFINFYEKDGGRIAKIFDENSLKNGGQLILQQRCDTFWWLSLMQHYRQPTRLIDFTKDICIALYFAIEQYENYGEKLDLIIYCFPCKDPKYKTDNNNNKTPIIYEENFPDVNMDTALGIHIGLPDYINRSDYEGRTIQQLFGWDRPYYQNPRLYFQRGMFVYPYNYPDRELIETSWLIQNLKDKQPDHFNMKGLPAKRIRIPHKHKDELKKFLEKKHNLNEAIIYVDYERIKLEN